MTWPLGYILRLSFVPCSPLKDYHSLSCEQALNLGDIKLYMSSIINTTKPQEVSVYTTPIHQLSSPVWMYPMGIGFITWVLLAWTLRYSSSFLCHLPAGRTSIPREQKGEQALVQEYHACPWREFFEPSWCVLYMLSGFVLPSRLQSFPHGESFKIFNNRTFEFCRY